MLNANICKNLVSAIQNTLDPPPKLHQLRGQCHHNSVKLVTSHAPHMQTALRSDDIPVDDGDQRRDDWA